MMASTPAPVFTTPQGRPSYERKPTRMLIKQLWLTTTGIAVPSIFKGRSLCMNPLLFMPRESARSVTTLPFGFE